MRRLLALGKITREEAQMLARDGKKCNTGQLRAILSVLLACVPPRQHV